MASRVANGVVLAAALLLSACAADDVPAAPADDAVLVQGQEIYAKNCVNCHGSAGGGGVGTRLNQGRVLEDYPDAADQLALVAEGRKAMPSFDGKLSEAELDAVVRYTREVIAEQQ